MNVAIINLKEISKTVLKFIIGSICLVFLVKVLITNVYALERLFLFDTSSLIYTSLFTNINESNFEYDYQSFVKVLYPFTIAIEENPKVINKKTEVSQEEKKTEISKSVNVEAVAERNINENYNITYSNVKIRNQSDYDLTDDVFSFENLELLDNKKILIYHTHTCESYTPSEKYNYTMTGNYRTTDKAYSVVRLGDELTNLLQEKGFEVIHNTTYHDYPSYNGSYDRSLETIQGILSQNSDIQLVIDLHRDAVGDGASYGPTVKINGQSVAQMMLVVGTDGGGLEHPNWKQNVKSAVKLQSKANEIYPGLFRPMIIRNSRYNQHVAPGAWIIEVGATGNTLDECLLSMQCLANAIEDAF